MQRLRRMDGLRGVLAVYVMLGHALPLTALPAWVQAPFGHGEAAVDLFFALSGLVIAQSLDRFEGHYGAFLAARARRLLPVYFLVLPLAIGVTALGDPLSPWATPGARDIFAPGLPPRLWAHVVAHVLLLHGVIPQAVLPYAYVTLLGPAWSLSTEAQFYVLIGGVAPRRLAGFALALLGVAALYRLSPLSADFSRAFLPDAAPYFALGIASAVALRGEGWGVFWVCLAGACLLAGGTKSLIPLAWAGVMAAQAPGWGRVLEQRALLYFGAVSYPLYLVNEPVERLAALACTGGFAALYLPLALGGALLAAAALHRFVELRPKVIAAAALR